MRYDSDETHAHCAAAIADDRFPGYEGLALSVLRRYVKGESEPAERRRIDAWAAEAMERRRYLAVMHELYARGSTDDLRETRAAWERIAARMEPPAPAAAITAAYVAPWNAPAVRVDLRCRQAARILGGAFPRQRRMRGRLIATAAAATAIVALAIGTVPRLAHIDDAAPAPPVRMREIATTKGQRAEITLGDGSRVVLGVESHLRFASDFGTAARDLYLDGTAYFDVVHDSTRPFVVHTANAVTEDIGTRFVVTAYPESHATQVVVASGAVSFGASHAPRETRAVLTRGHLGLLASGGQAPLVRRVDVARYLAWMDGELVFRDTPLSDVVAELRRWYAVDLRIADPSLRTIPLTASFAAESFQEALTVVTTVAPLRAVRNGRVVTLRRR